MSALPVCWNDWLSVAVSVVLDVSVSALTVPSVPRASDVLSHCEYDCESVSVLEYDPASDSP